MSGTSARTSYGPQVLLQARPNLFSHAGGDTVVVRRLMATLTKLGARVRFSPERGVPPGTDVVHTIDSAPPDTIRAFAEDATRAGVPLVVTTRYEDRARYVAASTAAAALFRLAIDPHGARRAALDRHALAAALARVRRTPDTTNALNDVAAGLGRVLLCCGAAERARVVADYPAVRDVRVIPFGADSHAEEAPLPAGMFATTHGVRDFVLCVARLEPRKNQLMLLEALRDDPRPLVFVTGGFSYHPEYARLCRTFRRRGPTLFLERLESPMLAAAFREAAVHCLPSWYDLPGLVSLEAALHGTRVAASSWGAIEDYLGDAIAYLEPDDPEGIRRAVETARALAPASATERARAFTWERAARATLALYEEIAPTAGASAPRAVAATVAESVSPVVPMALAAPTPVPPPAPLADAAHARVAGDWQQVLRHAERAEAAGAEYTEVTELRALALTHLGRFDDAEAQFASLLGATRYRQRAEAGLGIIALERGDDLTARAWLERATAAGGDADTWAALGLCLSRLAEAEEAWRAFVEARTREPAHRTALHGLVTLATPLARVDELETHLRDYLARVGEDADVRYALAGCLYAAGRREESRTAVREVLRQAPAHALARALEHELAS
jgi:glycosyltransferase involved in cell wall biosynthesis